MNVNLIEVLIIKFGLFMLWVVWFDYLYVGFEVIRFIVCVSGLLGEFIFILIVIENFYFCFLRVYLGVGNLVDGFN